MNSARREKTKKIALLSQIAEGFSYGGEVRGVARAEIENGGRVVTVSLVRLAPLADGKYDFCFVSGGRAYSQVVSEEGGRFFVPPEFGKDADGAGVAVIHSASGKIVAYGKFSPDAPSEKEAAEIIFGGKKEPKPSENAETEYDDEVVATENYYGFSGVNMEELTVEDEDGKGEEDGVYEGAENDGVDGGNKQEQEEKVFNFESGYFHAGDGGEEKDYYGKISAKIEKLFSEFPPLPELADMVEDSKWVRIEYDGDREYAVGVINGGGRPRYVCYGVPGKYGKKPDEIKNYCSFIPLSKFSLKGEGFWVIYQDAETGKCL